MNRFELILGVLFAIAFSCCKNEKIPVKSQVVFKLSTKKAYSGISEIIVENKSNGIVKFEWYIDNNFITSASVLSSTDLLSQTVNKKHEIKLIGNTANGELMSFSDSFLYVDTFNFSQIMFKNLTNQFESDFLSDTNFVIAISLVNEPNLNSAGTVHTPPKRVNILPHTWTKDSFLLHRDVFVNRSSLGFRGVLGGGSGFSFFLDVVKAKQYQLIVTKFFYKQGSFAGVNSIPISSISVNESNHILTYVTNSFSVSLR
jgi:hypothetical protein